MVDTITYRTTDLTRWGGGIGTNLSATQIDTNFWVLSSQLSAIQDHITGVADIDFFNVVGDQMYVHLTNHVVLGPYTLPTARWTARGPWTADTIYAAYDVVTNDNAAYLVLVGHTSSGSFDPGATDGMGHDLYGLLIAAATNALPPGGTYPQRLAKNSDADFDVAWVSDYRNLAIYIEGVPTPSELLLRFVCVDNLTLPIGLTGSQGSAGVAATADSVFTIELNGSPIGTITYPAGGSPSVEFSFTGVANLNPGDVLSIIAPASPDATLADISLTLQATLTG